MSLSKCIDILDLGVVEERWENRYITFFLLAVWETNSRYLMALFSGSSKCCLQQPLESVQWKLNVSFRPSKNTGEIPVKRNSHRCARQHCCRRHTIGLISKDEWMQFVFSVSAFFVDLRFSFNFHFFFSFYLVFLDTSIYLKCASADITLSRSLYCHVWFSFVSLFCWVPFFFKRHVTMGDRHWKKN